MTTAPAPVAEFLAGRRLAVAGVSRDRRQAANAVYRTLRDAGYEALPVNPATAEVEGVRCYNDIASLPDGVDGVVVATHPGVSLRVVRACLDRGIGRIWLHRSFGTGSVAVEAVAECRARGASCLVGGCPLMYVEPVDLFHRCARSWLRWRRRVPG